MINPCLSPTPRSFNHINLSNNSLTWGGKYELQCVASITLHPGSNVMLGDSNLERLSRPALSSLLQAHFPNWVNFGIGGDRVEHVTWRALHGSCPDAPDNILLWMGSNNLRNVSSSKDAKTIANSIINSVRSLLIRNPQTHFSVVGIMPQRSTSRTEAGKQINNILNFQLPASVSFIPSPFEHWSPTYFTDDVHLNMHGYNFLFNSTHFKSLIQSTHTSTTPTHQLTNDYSPACIGRPEYIGKGWDGNISSPPIPTHISPSASPSPSCSTIPSWPLLTRLPPISSLSHFPPFGAAGVVDLQSV